MTSYIMPYEALRTEDRSACMAGETQQPTPAELGILQDLWKLGPSTVRDVHAAIVEAARDGRTTGYTTTLKLLQIMTEKGLVSRQEVGREIGRASCRERCRSRWSPYH